MTVLSWDAGPTKYNTAVQMGTNTLLLFNPKSFSDTFSFHQDEKANNYWAAFLFILYLCYLSTNALS